MKLNDMRVNRKLWLVILGLLVLMLALSWWSLRSVRVAGDEAMDAIEAYESKITKTVRWRGATETATTMVVGSTITTDAALSQVFDARVKDLITRISEMQADVSKSATSAADKQALEAIAAERTTVLALTAKTREIKKAGDAAATQAFIDRDYLPALARYLKTLDDLVTVQEQERDAARAAADDKRLNVVYWAIGAVVLVFLLGIWLAAALVRSIMLPLDRAVAAANAIAEGKLTLQIEESRRDEFGDLLRALGAMTERLRGLVSEVRFGVESVSSASSEIANGNQDLSARTEQTASNLEQTAASMEQLTSTVTQSADTARQANQLAANAAQAANRGGAIVAQVVSSMQNISESSRKISDIIGTIDSIAFQTNILALNAAVEAARAGEQGRGFAVVATEVRALAGRSAEAAKQIKSLIGASVQTVESGSQQVAEAGQSMGDIVSSVQRVSDLIGEISASSVEQRDGIAQVNLAVNNLDQMTQQNAALVEESAAAAAGLRDQAQRLSQVVSVFDVGGHTRAPAPPPQQLAAPHRAAAPALSAASIRQAPRPLAAPARPRAVMAAAPPVGAAPRLGSATAGAAHKPAAAPRVAPRPAAAAPQPAAAPRPAARPVPPPRAATAKSDDGDWESF